MEVLQPVRRRRRRRRRIVWRRLSPLALICVVSAAAGLVVGARHGASGPEEALAAKGAVAPERAKVEKPEVLLTGPAVVRTPVALAGETAIVVDARSGRVLWEKRPHERRQVASTTKIMTALLALRKLGPHKIVTVDKSVPRVPLVREGLRAGEQVEAWKLFYGTLLYSGNDSALALAIAAGGSRPAFVAMMNEEAKRLGLRDSHFRSPSGVEDADNYSSAWDMAALTRVAMRNARFRAIVRTKRKEVPWAAPTNSKIYLNKNLMLTRYRGANGVKTGYTTKAGPCIVVSATRHGISLIAVVLHSLDEYADATKLLDVGFRAMGVTSS